ncbi:MAG: ABC-F family ATP-binding cassette domain-containing protein [Candidatus Omnitrophica bacterium]|nr:ABC-F family ATP-binding cassette domain-containing protein [Candidatus Omnitrophota bacterium]HPP01898.1 ABC-F family ATP-binding cassette domain-containing protein [bacterium]
MISITDGELLLGGKPIFSNLSWRIDRGKRIGLVGPNGAGKTSLLRVLAGEYPLEKGIVEKSRGLRIGYLPQDCAELPRQRVGEILWQAFEPLNAMEREIHTLLDTIQTAENGSPAHDKALHRYAELQEEFHQRGGYQRESEAKKIMLGLGFQHADWDRPAAEFSGGWRMRILLARLLLEKSDILLLDEPTNHLDPESLAWFEQYLLGTESGLVIVSHDRYFLDRIVTQIAEIERGRFRLYPGHYSQYRIQKQAIREQLMAQKQHQDREIAHLERFIERFKAKNTKASQAQSRIKRLEKIERIEIETEAKTVTIPLPPTPRSGREVLMLDRLGHCYGEVRALHPFSAVIHRGGRVAVWGPNGAGKTTLLSLMAKILEPTEGSVQWGYNTHIAYFSQHHAELQDSQQSVLEELSAVAPAEMQARLRDVLAAFLFQGDDVFKPVSVLSGGEKSRLALAKLLVRPVNVLIMDEPLNHLDIATVETLEETLKTFAGTIVFVSHDRFFADRLATQIWEMQAGRVTIFQGNFQDYDYAKRLQVSAAPAAPPPAGQGTGDPPSSTREQRKEQRRREAEARNHLNALRRKQEKECAAIEEKIHAAEAEIQALETQLSSGEFVRDENKMAELSRRYKQAIKLRDRLYEKWEELVDALECGVQGG